MITLETTDPLGICVGPDVVRRYNAREQKFLIARDGRLVARYPSGTEAEDKGLLSDLADGL